MKTKLVYVSNGNPSVYESQVLELLSYMQRSSIDVTLLQGYSNKSEKILLDKKLARYSITTVWVKSYSPYPILANFNIKNFYEALITIPNYQSAVIHIRSEYMGYIFKKIFQRYKVTNPILIDIRGIVYEEVKFKLDRVKHFRHLLFKIQKTYYKKIYKLLFINDDAPISISSVSPRINKYIKDNYPDCKYLLSVNPNIAGSQFIFSDEQRSLIREKYGIKKDDIVAICSTGGNALWQQDHLVIQSLVDKGIKVINLSRKDINITGCITTTVPFSEMPNFLSAGDIAVLWRDNDFINQSSSPSKFSEFASMGLFVIHNETVQIATDYILKYNSGYIAHTSEDVLNIPIDKLSTSERHERINIGKETFGVESIGQSYIYLYNKILNKYNILNSK